MKTPEQRHIYVNKKTSYTNRWEYRANINKPVDENYIPPIQEYYQYLDKNDYEKNRFGKYIEELQRQTINIEKCNIEYFLQNLIHENIIVNNQELFSHIKNFLLYLEENNKYHQKSAKDALKVLNYELHSDNRKFATKSRTSKFKKIDYSRYENSGDFRKHFGNHILNALHAKGGEIYLDKKGKIYLKLKGDVKFEPYTNKEAEEALSYTLGMAIKITNKFVKVDDEIIVEIVDDEIENTKLIGENK